MKWINNADLFLHPFLIIFTEGINNFEHNCIYTVRKTEFVKRFHVSIRCFIGCVTLCTLFASKNTQAFRHKARDFTYLLA